MTIEFGDIQGQPPSATTGLAKLVQDRFTWCKNLRFLQQEKWLSAKMNFDGIDYVDGYMYADVHVPLTVQTIMPIEIDFSL